MYQLYFPAEPLRPFIECYWIARASADQPITLQENVFVDGKADMLFNFGVAYARNRLDFAHTEAHLPISNLDAQRIYPVAIQQQGQVDLIAVRFRPGGLTAFLEIPAHEITNLTLNLLDGLGRAAQELESQLFDCRHEAHQQIALLDAFFLQRLHESSSHTFARHIACLIEMTEGQASIHQLSRDMGYSIRSVDRFFSTTYGFSPKFYARIIRFQRAIGLMIQNPDRSLMEIAFQCGYYDQSHFNKEFADFTGDSPEHYRAILIAKAAAPPPNLSTFYKTDS